MSSIPWWWFPFKHECSSLLWHSPSVGVPVVRGDWTSLGLTKRKQESSLHIVWENLFVWIEVLIAFHDCGFVKDRKDSSCDVHVHEHTKETLLLYQKITHFSK